MAFVRTYLAFGVIRRHRTVLGYACTFTYGTSTYGARCKSGETTIRAVPNH
jgi:hypothetical protein